MSKSTLHDLLSAITERRVVVVGDFLLDQYMFGNSSRVSREAPIVVIDYERTVNLPGGAANAAQNVSALGAQAAAIGVIGDDREGEVLSTLLSERGVDCAGLIVDHEFETSVKLRIMAGELNAQKQQVARIDRSNLVLMTDELTTRLRAAMTTAIDGADAVLISDYGLGMVPGVLSELAIAQAGERRVPVVVDSRYRLNAFAGATAATPNEVEVLDALNLKTDAALTEPGFGARIVKDTGIEGFVVTRGSKGMLIFDGANPTQSIDVVGSDQATDVTGAGDTVSAVVSLCLAAGSSLADAARMATYAASIVVMKRGTATVSIEELKMQLDTYPA